MNNEIEFGYYYGAEAEQFAFFRIPKMLFTDSTFSGVSVEAKLLYGMMLDRMSLSMKNKWLDEENRVYIIFTVKEITDTMMCSEQKVTKMMKELDSKSGIGLIERKRRGLGKADIIYVKSFVLSANNIKQAEEMNEYNDFEEISETDDFDAFDYEKISTESMSDDDFMGEKASNNQEPPKSRFKNHENGGSRTTKNAIQEPQNSRFLNRENHVSRTTENAFQEPPNSWSNNTNINNTKENNINNSNTNLIISSGGKIMLNSNAEEKKSRRLLYRQLIYSNISYDIIIQRNNKDRIDEMVEMMLDVICSNKPELVIGGGTVSQKVISSRLLKLNSNHIEYVIECMDNCTSKIKNIKQYMLTALYNSLSTIENYYTAQVNYDFRENKGGTY